jgi:putative ABC transport system permease protein
LRAALAAEFAVLGAIAGTLAGGGSALISMALARWAFHLPYTPNPLLVGIGLASGTLLVAIAGMAGSRGALRGSALQALRAAA